MDIVIGVLFWGTIIFFVLYKLVGPTTGSAGSGTVPGKTKGIGNNKNTPRRKIHCPSCGSDNVSLSIVQIGGRTRKHGTGLGGKANNAARGLTAVSTLGASNLVWKKSGGTEKMTFTNQKVGLCQDCGQDWKISL